MGTTARCVDVPIPVLDSDIFLLHCGEMFLSAEHPMRVADSQMTRMQWSTVPPATVSPAFLSALSHFQKNKKYLIMILEIKIKMTKWNASEKSIFKLEYRIKDLNYSLKK